MDETAAARVHDYVSVFADMDRARALFATTGRDGATVARFAADLSAHGGDPAKVSDTSSDMSAAYIAGIGEHLPNAAMTFDKFHVVAKLGQAVDAVRRDEVATRPELKRTRWLWLKNWSNLSAKQQAELHRLTRPSTKLATARALLMARGLPSLLRSAPRLRRRNICAGGVMAPNAHGCNRSRSSSRWWSATGTASWPGMPAG